MGQKVLPYGLRLGINKDWKSRWYVVPRDYAKTLQEDLLIRRKLNELPECKVSDISEVEIIRHPQRVTVVIHTARPGVLIGVKGANIEKIGNYLQKLIGRQIQIKIKEIKKFETNAQVVAQSVARQLESRGSYRKAMKMAILNAMKAGAQGCKIRVSGRLNGADIARSEENKDGRVPLHTLRADIDYGFSESQTAYGKIGVKVWIYQGMVFRSDKTEDAGMLVRKQRISSHDDSRSEDSRPEQPRHHGPNRGPGRSEHSGPPRQGGSQFRPSSHSGPPPRPPVRDDAGKSDTRST